MDCNPLRAVQKWGLPHPGSDERNPRTYQKAEVRNQTSTVEWLFSLWICICLHIRGRKGMRLNILGSGTVSKRPASRFCLCMWLNSHLGIVSDLVLTLPYIKELKDRFHLALLIFSRPVWFCFPESLGRRHRLGSLVEWGGAPGDQGVWAYVLWSGRTWRGGPAWLIIGKSSSNSGNLSHFRKAEGVPRYSLTFHPWWLNSY